MLERRGKILGLFSLDNMLILPLPNVRWTSSAATASLRLNVQARDPTQLAAGPGRGDARCSGCAAT